MAKLAKYMNALDDDSDASSSQSGSEDEAPKPTKPQVKRAKKDIDLETLQEHGYTGGPSVLFVPEPKVTGEANWDWSSGKEAKAEGDTEEGFAERERNRAAGTSGVEEAARQAQLAVERAAQLRADAKAEARAMADKGRLTFQQKEKRKRELGQAKKSTNYVEEEKRVARNFGVYSGFD